MQYEFGGLARKELSDIAFKRGILRLCSLGIKAIRGMIRKYRTYCTVRIGSVETLCMLDSGNTAYSACDPRLFKALGLTSDDLRPVRGGSNISTAKKRASLRVLGETKDLIPVQISPFTAPLMIRLVVMPELDMPLNLSGRDMAEHNMVMHLGKFVTYQGRRIPMTSRSDYSDEIRKFEADLYIRNKVTVKPKELVHVQAITRPEDRFIIGHDAILSSVESFSDSSQGHPWHNASVHISPNRKDEPGTGICKVGIINSCSEPIHINAGTHYGKIEIMNDRNGIQSPFRVYSKENFNVISSLKQHHRVSRTEVADYRDEELRMCRISIDPKQEVPDPSREQFRNKESREPDRNVSQNNNKPQENKEHSPAFRHGKGRTAHPGEESSIGATDGCFVHKKDRERLKLPKDPDKQDDPMVGEQLKLPDWMKGPTTDDNMKRRYSYLNDLFNIPQNNNISKNEQKRFTALLLKHWGLFAWDGTYGKTTLVEHFIKTDPSKRPVNERYRAHNEALDASLEKQIKTWLRHGVIEPSDSPWNSCLLAVVKASGSTDVRWTVDYRKLNAQTEIDRFPIGNIEDNLARLGKSSLFSALDNAGAFHVISIAKEDRPKTSFSTKHNCWQFTCLPFGLSGGPSSYARLVVQVLRGIPPEMAVAYVDDVLVHSNGFEKHLSNLDRVMTAYTRAGLRLNPAKCTFLASRVHYLGHTVSKDGLEPQRDYVDVVRKWPVPNTRQKVLVFLGKIGYYRRFIEGYARRAKPLTDMLKLTDIIKETIKKEEKSPDNRIKLVKQTRKGQAAREKEAILKLTKSQRRRIMDEEFTPSRELVDAFNDLKKTLLTAPILGHPRFDRLDKEPFILDTDWCKDTNTVSGCLLQRQLGLDNKPREVTIGYAAKKLSKSQASYSSGKGELCAIVMMMSHFRYHLHFGRFILRTDSSAARALKDSNDPTGMLARWRQRLAAFSFDAYHRAGAKHGNADGLSRIDFLSYNSDDDNDPFDEKTDRQYIFSINAGTGKAYLGAQYITRADKKRTFKLNGKSVPVFRRKQGDLYMCSLRVLSTLTEDSTGTVTDVSWTPEYTKQIQEEDDDINQVREWVKESEKPTSMTRAEASEDLKSYINLLDNLHFDDKGVLRYRKHFNHPKGGDPYVRDVILLPPSTLKDAIKTIHERRGHLGVDNTLLEAARHVHGNAMRAKTTEVCQSCLTCQEKGGKPQKQDFHLQPARQGYPFQSINCDIVGPLTKSRQQHEYILTVQCMFTRWMEAFPLRRPTALEVAMKLSREVFPRFGFPSIIKVDNGTHFKNHVIQDLTNSLGIKVVFSPPYHPQSNPVERQHRTLKSILTSIILSSSERRPAMWEDYLPAALFAVRTMVNKTTGYTPYKLLFGREAGSELDILFGSPPDRKDYPDKQTYVQAMEDQYRKAFKYAKENISTTIRRSRRYYYNQPARKFKPGDQVWLLTPIIVPGQRKSFRSPFTGPWTVVRAINEVTYEIQPHHGWGRTTNQVAAVDRLKKWVGPVNPDDEVNVEDTRPPGINDDLSMPGDEHLEEIPTEAVVDDDDGEELLAPEPFLRPDSPQHQEDFIAPQRIQRDPPAQPPAGQQQPQHQPHQQQDDRPQQHEADPPQLELPDFEPDPVMEEEENPAPEPPEVVEAARAPAAVRPRSPARHERQEPPPAKRKRGRPTKEEQRQRMEAAADRRHQELLRAPRHQPGRRAKTEHKVIPHKARDNGEGLKAVEPSGSEPDLTDQRSVLEARRRHAEQHDSRRPGWGAIGRLRVGHAADQVLDTYRRQDARRQEEFRGRGEGEFRSPEKTAQGTGRYALRRRKARGDE